LTETLPYSVKQWAGNQKQHVLQSSQLEGLVFFIKGK